MSADTVLWDMGGIFRVYFTEPMVELGRRRGWPLDELGLGPTGPGDDEPYWAMWRGELGEPDYLAQLLDRLRAAGIDFDPKAQQTSFFPDRPATWTLLREIAADPGRRQAILTNDAANWIGERWWETWEHRHLFDAIVDSSMLGVRKPDPAPWREVLRRLGDPEPSTVVFVDDMRVNCEAAEALGLRTVLFDITDPEGSIARVREVIGR